MPTEVTITGLDEAKAKLLALAGAVPLKRALAAAVKQEAESILTVAQVRTPVKWGNLRASGHVTTPETRGDTISVTIGFGGPAAGYALYVHERIELHHRVGQAKFLESAALEWQHGTGPANIKGAFDAYVASLVKK